MLCVCFFSKKVTFLQGELVWAQVEEREAAVKHAELSIKEKEVKVERSFAALAKYKDVLTEKVSEETRLAHELQIIDRASDDVSVKLTEAREEMQEAELHHSKLVRDCNQIPKKITPIEKRIVGLEELIATEQARAMGEQGKEELERVQQLKDLREQLNLTQHKFDSLSSETLELQSVLTRCNEEIGSADAQERRMDKELAQLRTQAANLAKPTANKDPSFLWGNNLPDVVQLIERNKNKFAKVPIGPLGRCIKLKHEEYTVRGGVVNVVRAMESLLGKVFALFWCDNYNDVQTLNKLVIFPKKKKYLCFVVYFS
jgi:DNA repair exonuclease SbcCD ATPase subunit